MRRISTLLLVFLFLCWIPSFAETTGQVGGMDSTGAYYWTVDHNGVFTGSTGGSSIASISLGGVTKYSWGSVISPWEDDGTTTTLTSAPAKFILTHATGVSTFTGYIAGTADIVLENGQIIDGGTNNQVILTENSDSFDIEFTGDDITLRPSDGGIIFVTVASDATGTFNFQARGDTDDELTIDTISNVPTISTTGSSNLAILSSSGEITFGDENLTTTGTLDAGLTTITSGVIGDDTYDVVVDDQFRFASNDEESTIEAYGFEAKAAVLQLSADQGDDAGDKFQIVATTGNALIFTSDTSVKDTHATILTLAKTGLLTTTNDIYVVEDSATTNAVVDVLKVEVTSTGTATEGLGVGIVFSVEDEATTPEEQASLDVAMTDSTNGSEDADMIFSINTAGAIAEVGRFVAASSSTTGDSFTITQNTTETNAVLDILTLTNVTGTATNGAGLGISFEPEDATGAEQHASIDIVQTTAARTTNDTDFVFTQDVNGTLEERVRFDADDDTILLTGTTPKMTIGDGGDEDAILTFDGQTNDFYIGFDTTDDLLNIGVGSTPGTTAAIEISAASDVIIVSSLKTPVGAEVGTNTLTINESGKLVVLNHGTEFTTTLPAVSTASGVTYRIVLAVSPDTGVMDIKTDSGENKIYGVAIVNGAVIPAAAEDTITFTSSAALIGDWVELTSDGTNWYVSGQAAAATGIVFTAT